jgi:hypothetical protein
MATDKDLLDAVGRLFEALSPLDDESRDRALSSVRALLGMTSEAPVMQTAIAPSAREGDVGPPSARPLSLVELMNDRNPTTNPQTIAVFAYYRERVEAKPRFSRADLKYYFPKARLSPPGNYDRDFSTAVKHGWIHEDGSESYLTTRGIEAVESGFTSATPATAKRATKRRATSTKKPTKKKVSRRPRGSRKTGE